MIADRIFVDCFYYGFFMTSEQLRPFRMSSLGTANPTFVGSPLGAPVPTNTPRRVGMKRKHSHTSGLNLASDECAAYETIAHILLSLRRVGTQVIRTVTDFAESGRKSEKDDEFASVCVAV